MDSLLGRGLGSVIGGLMIQRIGKMTSFQVLAFCCLVASCLYFLTNKFIFTKKSNKPQEIEKSAENKNVKVNIDESIEALVSFDTKKITKN